MMLYKGTGRVMQTEIHLLPQPETFLHYPCLVGPLLLAGAERIEETCFLCCGWLMHLSHRWQCIIAPVNFLWVPDAPQPAHLIPKLCAVEQLFYLGALNTAALIAVLRHRQKAQTHPATWSLHGCIGSCGCRGHSVAEGMAFCWLWATATVGSGRVTVPCLHNLLMNNIPPCSQHQL